MKKNLLLLLMLVPTVLFADSWDDLTIQEARQVEEFLIQNPYILDYCDCCQYDGEYAVKVYLMKVTAVGIVPCEWDSEKWSVSVHVERIAEIPYSKEGLDINSPLLQNSDVNLITTISMNYTWGYDKEKGKAAPLCNIIPYAKYADEIDTSSGVCKELTSFPDPKLIKNEKYKKWYDARFK